MKIGRKLAEDTRHAMQVVSNNIEHKEGIVGDNIYEAKEAVETIRHAVNEVSINHPNNFFIKVFNDAVEKVSEAIDVIDSAITSFYEHFC